MGNFLASLAEMSAGFVVWYATFVRNCFASGLIFMPIQNGLILQLSPCLVYSHRSSSKHTLPNTLIPYWTDNGHKEKQPIYLNFRNSRRHQLATYEALSLLVPTLRENLKTVLNKYFRRARARCFWLYDSFYMRSQQHISCPQGPLLDLWAHITNKVMCHAWSHSLGHFSHRSANSAITSEQYKKLVSHYSYMACKCLHLSQYAQLCKVRRRRYVGAGIRMGGCWGKGGESPGHALKT